MVCTTYDNQGRRIKKQVEAHDGATWTTTTDTLYLYHGWNLVAEIDNTTATPVRTYTWGHDLSGTPQGAGGIGGLLAIQDTASGVTHLPTYDGNGNLTALVDAATGEQTATYIYSPFGQLDQIEGSYADKNPFRFSTKYRDAETGLYYYGYRYYRADWGRWLNRDPIGERGGRNLYAFVSNDGVNAWDYLGLKLEEFTKDPSSLPLMPAGTEIFSAATRGSHKAGQARWLFGAGTSLREISGDSLKQKLVIEGKLIVDLFYNRDVMDDPESYYGDLPASPFSPSRPREGNLSTAEHERYHAAIAIRNWNELKKLIDPWEKAHCKPCGEHAQDLVNGLIKLHEGRARLENGQFDRAEYGGGASGINQGGKLVREGEDKIRRATEKLLQRGCKMPPIVPN